MTNWQVLWLGKKPLLRNPVLVEGLPGIGNVGKLAADFMVEELNAKKAGTFVSNSLPHSVFVNEENLVELPSIDLYYKKMPRSKRDLLIIAGDVQPSSEVSCYEFSHSVLDVFGELKGSELITLGGIALRQPPMQPKVFCTGTEASLVDDYMKAAGNKEGLYGIVGPIVGVSGVLIGLAGRRRMKAVSLLAETYAHPLYLGVSGAREILRVLDKKLRLKLNLENLDREIAELEQEIGKKSRELVESQRKSMISKLRGKMGKEISYIG